MKRFMTLVFAAAIGCTPFVNAQSNELNPSVTAKPELIDPIIGAYDFYPIVWGGYGGLTSYLAVSCQQDTPPGETCRFNLYWVPTGLTDVNISFNNSVPPRGVRVYDVSQLTGLNDSYGILWVDSNTHFGASKIYLDQPCGCLMIDDPIQFWGQDPP